MRCSECVYCGYANSGYYICNATTGVPPEQTAILPGALACEKFVPRGMGESVKPKLPNDTKVDANSTKADTDKPTHYIKLNGGDALDVMQQLMTKEQFIGFLWGNILKYAVRFGRKDEAVSEARKIAAYANKLKEVLS